MPKLTKTIIDRLQPRDERYEVACDELRGFVVRVNVNGTKTSMVRYYCGGRWRRFTLGKLGQHFTLAKARTQARTVLGRVASGQDPARERKRKLEAPLFSALAERFMKEHAGPYLKPRTVAGYETILRVHVLPALGNMRVEEIERSDVERLHQRVGKDAPGAANRMVAFLSCVMNKAETWGYRRLQSNPCHRMRKFKERKIERYLSGEERARLAEVLAAAEQAPRGGPGHVSQGAIKVIRLLELTGARCGEITGLEWSMVQLERGCLALPDSGEGEGATVIPFRGRRRR